jgi:hypothetical protein
MSETPEYLLQQDWAGDCYGAALNWITVAEEADWTLIHGTILNERLKKRFDHAWCERGNIVVDLVMPIGMRIFMRDQYYRVLMPEVSKIYSSDVAVMLSLRSGHQGPWHKSEQPK